MTTITSDRTICNPIFGDSITFIETAAETGGARSRSLIELAPGAEGPPLHRHTSCNETFTVLKGVLGVQLGANLIQLEKGECCTAERGTYHRFFNPSATETVIFEGLATPAGSEIETMLQVGYGLVNDGLTNQKGVPKKWSHLALLLYWGDTHLPGFFGLLTPIMRLLAQKAVRQGVDRQLRARYCRIEIGR